MVTMVSSSFSKSSRTANTSTPACYLLDQALPRLLCFIISTTETPNVKVFYFLCKNSGPQHCQQICLGHSALRISQTGFYLCVCVLVLGCRHALEGKGQRVTSNIFLHYTAPECLRPHLSLNPQLPCSARWPAGQQA